MNKRRVVITGLGVVSPIASNIEDFEKAIFEGRNGIDIIKQFDVSGLPVQMAGEVKDFDVEKYFERKEARRIGVFMQYGIASAMQALEDAGFKTLENYDERAGVIVGCGIGGVKETLKDQEMLEKRGYRRVSPFLIPKIIPNLVSGLIAINYGIKGPNFAVVSACASGSHAIGEAYEKIVSGKADIMVAVGAEAAITPLTIAGFHNMGALSKRNDEPTKASRPFTKSRDGFVMGEGAGTLILEEYEHAKKRGAKIYAELVGYGSNDDAYHITAPEPEAKGMARTIQLALEDAGIKPEQVGYVNAHGTSTPLNDKIETLAIKKVFGEHAYKLKVSSLKSMIGHLLGAAGAVEAVATVLCLKNQKVHPTINYDEPDPECDLDYVPNKAQDFEFEYAISNSFGFGGHNVTIVFKKWDE